MHVLIAGESAMRHTTEIVGIDTVELASYEETVGPLRDALTQGSHRVAHVPSHLVPSQFPRRLQELEQYDVVILSDIGSNSLSLSPASRSGTREPERLDVLRSWVQRGGGLLMIGGYLSFGGFQGRARYGATPLQEVLPVTCVETDDRVESSEGGVPTATGRQPLLAGIPDSWPALLGWNRTLPKPEAETLLTVGSDPLLVVGRYGQGRTAAFCGDCAPHWAPQEFLVWEGYRRLWNNLVQWLGRSETPAG